MAKGSGSTKTTRSMNVSDVQAQEGNTYSVPGEGKISVKELKERLKNRSYEELKESM